MADWGQQKFYMKVSITYLNTFILGCGSSLVMDRPDRAVAVLYESTYNILNYFYYWLQVDREDFIPSRPVAVT